MHASEIDAAVRDHRTKSDHKFSYVTIDGAAKEFCERCGVPKDRTQVLADGKTVTSPCRGFV